MFETFEFETLTPQGASVIFALMLGLVFGAAAQVTRFCIRRGLVGTASERRPALGLWMLALATAVVGTQVAIAADWITFADHRFMVSEIPVLAIVIGGALFGAGMVLTRGCISRLTVLTGTGNLRALMVLLVFAVTAHATLKGVLAPLRVSLGGLTTDLGFVSLADLPGGALFWSAVVIIGALAIVRRGMPSRSHAVLAVLIGLLVPLGWVGTGFVLFDEFDPIAMESLSFTSPTADTLFWTIASTAIPAGFGVGLLAGVVAGSFIMALINGGIELQSFSSPRETLRYGAGGIMMGAGGVLAGGCTVGAGLSGVPTLSVAAILALGAIAAGATAFNALLAEKKNGDDAITVPAE